MILVTFQTTILFYFHINVEMFYKMILFKLVHRFVLRCAMRQQALGVVTGIISNDKEHPHS